MFTTRKSKVALAMTIRRMIGGVLAAAAVASGVGLIAAPTAQALPQRCGVLIRNVGFWRNQYNYALTQLFRAQDSSEAAGCGG
jgi:hypothetical protein